jgi:hypothetical protein
MKPVPKSYNFILVLSGLLESNDSIEDALFEAGCDDALLIVRDNIPYLEFDREATSLEQAISSAIFDVKSAGAIVLRVEIENFANLSLEFAEESSSSDKYSKKASSKQTKQSKGTLK